MRALVTGGAGFIGSYLTELLLKEGFEVVVVDNFQVGNEKNLAAILKEPDLQAGLKIEKVDLLNKKAFEPLVKGVDWLFHLAALADVPASHDQPEEYYQINVTGTFNILEAAKKHNVKRLIYAASASCYGLNPKCPTTEEEPLSPASPYALTKRLGEELVLSWNKIYQLPTLSLRLFNVYGPRSLNKGTVLSLFLQQKRQGLPLTITGDGLQSRDFVYVTDVARAFFLAAQSHFSGEIFNVGSAQNCEIRRLVDLLGGRPTFLPERLGDPKVSLADISKIERLLDWHPLVSLEEGIKEVIKSENRS